MTKEVAQDWHRSSATVADNMTLRLGERFGDLCHWAVDQGLEFPVELSFHILARISHSVSASFANQPE
jgi:hypothetical protein